MATARVVVEPFYTSKLIKLFPPPNPSNMKGETDLAWFQCGQPWVWSNWVEISPALGTINVNSLITSVAIHTYRDIGPGMGNNDLNFQFGIGEAGAEVPIITVFCSKRWNDSSYVMIPPTLIVPLVIPRFLPKNSRIVTRARSNNYAFWVAGSFEYVEAEPTI
jgi:hypothetical protein